VTPTADLVVCTPLPGSGKTTEDGGVAVQLAVATTDQANVNRPVRMIDHVCPLT